MMAASESRTQLLHGHEHLAGRPEEWCRGVAQFLELAVPEGVGVHVHSTKGVPYVQHNVVHIFLDFEGRPDVAQLPHELVHVVAGHSPSRFLAEGLAVHVDAVLRLGRPAWPCYMANPDLWVVDLRSRANLGPLAQMMAETTGVRLSGAVTPERMERAWRLYVVAGSFVGHMFSRLGPRFWKCYRAGVCWDSDEELAGFETDWLDALPSALGPDEQSLLIGSREAARRDLRRALGRQGIVR